jgi:hypothetical protein
MESGIKTIILDGLGMPRLDQTDASAVLEAEFETTAMRLLARLHPNCHVFRFKPPVDLDGVVWQPDIALLHREFEYFCVVEIERYNKSLDKHVLPQVIGFRDGDYGEVAVAMIAEATGLRSQEARTVLHCIPRFVAVVVNGEAEGWREALASENVQMLSITQFGQDGGSQAYLISGQLQSHVRSLGIGTVHATEQAIRIKKSAYWIENRQYTVITNAGKSSWTGFDAGVSIWLVKDRGVVDLPNGKYVQFLQGDDDLISIRVL